MDMTTNRVSRVMLLGLVGILGACQSYPELRYTPERYAKYRNIELLTQQPPRSFAVIAEVKGYGGPHTATQTKINAIIDEARKAGADALIPVENADRGNTVHGLDVFVFTDDNQTIARGRAVRWTDAWQR